ncbi:COP23 domain-containing protein [Myxosarcina sp. GI1]|uniref:COP23 domain-containing protein n=1 Tax=Myxosarcina sp. GI1 TaxID=1541065 RepID=UPI00055D7A21|nr:COP23 domain-containing protein [Myxosarcina sp. GI1]
MKYKLDIISFAIASCFTAIAQPGFAQVPTQTGFRCDNSSGTFTTIYHNNQGVEEPWIQWVSDHFSGSGWTPEARCQEVSARLETFRLNKQLKYVTLGTINNQQVICVASQNQGPCEGIIYTLKPGQDGLQALNNLFEWRTKGASESSNYESVTEIPYIDVGSKLNETMPTPPIYQLESPNRSNREF